MGDKPTLDWITTTFVVCAFLMSGLALYTRFGPAEDNERDRVVRNWPDYLGLGRRIGPDGAKVVIVAFGDYQCPFCRAFDQSVPSILRESPGDVAFVYRHFPIPHHEHAYRAARFAECASEQGRFSGFLCDLYGAKCETQLAAIHMSPAGRIWVPTPMREMAGGVLLAEDELTEVRACRNRLLLRKLTDSDVKEARNVLKRLVL
jgi:hypothetical protein